MRRTPWILLALGAMLAGGATPAPTPAEEGPPAAPVVVGTFQPGVSGGACAAWSGACAATTMQPAGDRWAATLEIPAGGWHWRVAVAGDPSRSIGVGTRFDGDDAVLQFAQPRTVTFVFEPGRRAATSSADRTFGYAWQLNSPCAGEGPAPPPIDPATALLDPDGDGVSTATVDVGAAAGCLRVVDAAGRAVAVEPQALAGPVEIAFDARAGAAKAFPAGPPSADGRLDPLGFAHDSRDLAYRLPAGAAPAGSAIRLRFRTFHADATGVDLVVTGAEAHAPTRLQMARVAGPAPCGEDVVDGIAPCDWWEATITPPDPTTLTYRFEVTDGTARSFYADDPLLDGGRGEPTRLAVGAGYVITIHVPGVEPIPWLDGAVVYQVFPDRFHNGDPANDADVDAPRYGWPPDDEDRTRRRAWTDLPESPGRGRDWFGGDLAGIEANLPYLADLGVSVLYLNPVFSAASNHLYDTRDYREIDPRFGDGAAWRSIVAAAGELGIRIVLDGVFNHVSSDSPYFDRYGHFSQVGACESVDSPFRTWFVFRPAAGGPCAGPDGPGTMDYVGWSGLASLPVLVKTDAGVQGLVYGDANAVARRWLRAGAAGWRLDVMMDPSFAGGFWQAFRAAVKATDPEAAIVGELWSRSQVLPQVRGDSADTTMNYRFRNAVTGYLGTVDREGFPDSGESDQPPSLLARKLLSMYEDYPAFAARTAWNLLDSHDTERILWSLAPGEPKERETPASLAVGKARLRLASLLQFTLPGAPTIYYGDEIGMTGADDPDDRRTFPVLGEGGVLPASADAALHAWYRDLAATRRDVAVLRDGAVRFLVTDDQARTLAFSRYDEDGALAIVALNPDLEQAVTIEIPLAEARGPGSPVPDGIRFEDRTGAVAAPLPSAAGMLQVALPALGAAILVPAAGVDLAPPAAPAALAASAADGVRLTWAPVVDAARYLVERSALLDGPATNLGEVATPGFADGDVEPGSWVYTVRAVDAAGNVGPAATAQAVIEARATPVPGATPAGEIPGGEAPGGPLELSAALAALAGIALAVAVLVAIRRRSAGS